MKTSYLVKVYYPKHGFSELKIQKKDFLDDISPENKSNYTIIEELKATNEIRDYLESLNDLNDIALIDDDSKRIPLLIKHFEKEIRAFESIDKPVTAKAIDKLKKHINDLKEKIPFYEG